MPYLRIKEQWSMPVKDVHQFRLDVREGFWRDMIYLYMDDEVIATGNVTAFKLKGKTTFMVDGRILEMRWIWSMWSGNPLSIVIMRNDTMLAMYGCDEAAKRRL